MSRSVGSGVFGLLLRSTAVEKEDPNLVMIKPAHRRALAHLTRRDWDKAHAIVMSMRDKLAFRIHGLLHRIEGDLENARYWYDRAGVPFSESAASEIKEIAAVLARPATRSRVASATRTGTRRSPPRRSSSRRSRA